MNYISFIDCESTIRAYSATFKMEAPTAKGCFSSDSSHIDTNTKVIYVEGIGEKVKPSQIQGFIL